MEQCGRETFDNKHVKYILKNPNFRWTQVRLGNMSDVTNPVLLRNNVNTYHIGRFKTRLKYYKLIIYNNFTKICLNN
jgi:hypothetical protein